MFTSISLVSLFVCVGLISGQPLLGGKTDVDTNDATILEMANFAVAQKGPKYDLRQVISAQQQVVAGMMYYIKASVTHTDAAGSISYWTCDFEVVEQSWLSNVHVRRSSCATE